MPVLKQGPPKGSRLPKETQALILTMLDERMAQSKIARLVRCSRDQVRQVGEVAGVLEPRPSRGGMPHEPYRPVPEPKRRPTHCGECGQALPVFPDDGDEERGPLAGASMADLVASLTREG